MKKIISTCMGLAVMLTIGFLAQPALADMGDKAVGKWKTPKGSVVRLLKSGGKLVGTIVSVRDKSRRDSNNPNAKLRKRKLPGVRMLSLKKSGANSWSGSLYNTEDGKTYSGSLKVTGPNSVKLSGCVLAILCKTQVWSRQ